MKTDAGNDHGVGQRVGARGNGELTKAEAYAASLVQLAKTEAGLDAVDRDLRLAKSALTEHMALKKALTDPALPVEKKQAVIEELFGVSVSMVTLNFMQLLAGMGQIELLPDVAEAFAKNLEAEENKVIAEVTTAIPVDAAFSARLAGKLREITGRDVTIRPSVDADIIGGVIVRVDGKLLDGSVRKQLDRLREKMLVDLRGR